jgi:hypothetical protein
MTEGFLPDATNRGETGPARPIAGRRSRVSKESLHRLKVSAVVVAIAAFAGSLGGIIALNPGIKQASAASPASGNQTAPATIAIPPEPTAPQISSAPLQLPQLPQISQSQGQFFVPRTRSRGS